MDINRFWARHLERREILICVGARTRSLFQSKRNAANRK